MTTEQHDQDMASASDVAHAAKDISRAIKQDGTSAIIGELARNQVKLAELRRTIEKLQNQISEIQNEYKMMQIAIRSIDSLPIEKTEDFVSSVHLTAKTPLRRQDGFYLMEYDGNGQDFRWTGPDKWFSFDIFIDREIERKATLKLMAFSTGPKALSSVWVDGRPAHIAELGIDDTFASYEITLPAIDGTQRVTSLIFEASHVTRPIDDDAETADTRSLGLAFHSLVCE